MPPSWRQQRYTFSRESEPSAVQRRRIRRRLPDRKHLKVIARATGIGVGTAKVREDEASIVETAETAETVAAHSIGEIGVIVALEMIAAIEATGDAHLIADAPTAAVVRDVIAIGRERTERTFPPGWWLG